MTEQEKYVLSKIIRITKDKKSRAFWKKAIKELGTRRVEEDVGETEHRMRIGNIKSPAAYLTSLLKERMNLNAPPENKTASRKPMKKLKTYFEKSQAELFHNLQPIKSQGEAVETKMGIQYGKKIIPWATFIGPEFFTLSTNKKKSDEVMVRFRTLDNDEIKVPMLRGRISPKAKERSILTASHAKILAAIQNMWSQQDSPYNTYPNGVRICFCYAPARELAKLLNWKKFGGKDLIRLTDSVYDIKTAPYYLNLAKLLIKNIKGYGFSLFKSVELVNRKKKGQNETVFYIEFSAPLSAQLLDRRTIIKSKKMLTTRSELATLLLLYLEPKLRSISPKVFHKNLKDVITDMQLSAAAWHKYKSTRAQEFKKTIKEIDGHEIADGRKISVWIDPKGVFDFLLMGQLLGKEPLLVNNSTL